MIKKNELKGFNKVGFYTSECIIRKMKWLARLLIGYAVLITLIGQLLRQDLQRVKYNQVNLARNDSRE